MKVFKNLIFLIVVYALSSLSPTNAQEKSRITILGRATVELMPDTAVIRARITTRAKSASAAADANSTITKNLISFGKNFGKIAPVVETGMIFVRDETNQIIDPSTKTKKYEKIGYIASNSISIKTKETEEIGKLSREFLNFEFVSIQGIDFLLSDPSNARQTAQLAAFKNAKENAEKLAAAAGRKLGSLVRLVSPPREETIKISEDADMPSKTNEFSAEIPIEIGLLKFSAVVDTEWTLE